MSKESSDVIIKTMTIDKNHDEVYDFFINIKNWEKGGALKNIHKVDTQDLWEVDTPIGKARIKLKPNRQFGILDHDFIDSKGHSWTVFCRVIKNEDRATISWTFIRPEALSKEEFESQLLNFEMEMQGWKKALQN
jgi:hypothetical protein